MKKVKIAGTGSYLPKNKLTNKDLEKMIDTTDQWIFDRTGIRSRSVANKEHNTSDLAYYAAKSALEAANVSPTEVDLIIFSTVTPDQLMPNTACILQQKLGCKNIMAFDLSAACSGFVYALTVATQFIQTGFYKNVLIVGAEILSRLIDYEDRSTCILFGDGAGAALITESNDESQILSADMLADGSLGHLLTYEAGGSKLPLSQEVLDKKLNYMRMQGKEIFKNAVQTMAASSLKAIEKANLTLEDIDWVIPHQANSRIIAATAKQLKVSEEKCINIIEHMGNTSAATVPIALDQSIRNKKIKKGDTVLLTAFGAGLTSGSIVLKV